MLLFGLIQQDQELTPALQRLSKKGADRDSLSLYFLAFDCSPLHYAKKYELIF